jgi:hypothetical protein
MVAGPYACGEIGKKGVSGISPVDCVDHVRACLGALAVMGDRVAADYRAFTNLSKPPPTVHDAQETEPPGTPGRFTPLMCRDDSSSICLNSGARSV